MLIDFAFNLGTIRGYPKFVKAVLNKDVNTMRQEYKRSFTNNKGERKDMGRNKHFADRFFGSIMEKDDSAPIQKKSLGLEDEDAYGYELRSPFSWLKYTHSPSARLFSIKSVGTEPDYRNQGYARQVLDYFFQMVKKSNGVVEVDSYTTSGSNYIKHVVDRLAQSYNIHVV